jgi:hypothetical protein
VRLTLFRSDHFVSFSWKKSRRSGINHLSINHAVTSSCTNEVIEEAQNLQLQLSEPEVWKPFFLLIGGQEM